MRRRRKDSEFSSRSLARHRCEIRTRFSTPAWWICFVFLAAFSGVGALQVNIPQDIYEFVRGDNITLPCSFEPKGTAPLVIITWTLEGIQANAKENLIAVYYSHNGLTDIPPALEKRFSLDVDIGKRKANLKISSITLAENKVFECRVQIPGDDEGKLADTARLVVLVAPSKPICKIQGKVEYGQNINLTCVSEEGSPPPTYSWQSHDVMDKKRVFPPRTRATGGLLSLFSVTEDTSGYYICTSTNKIRSAFCNVTVSVMPHIYEFARGDNITLPCSFEPKGTRSAVIITWTLEGIQANAKENLIATHYSFNGKTDIPPAFEKRFSLDVDIAKRKANLKISSITLAENQVFECRVEIPGDEPKLVNVAHLVVRVAPSKPICKIQGKVEYGQNINLTCVSEEGSPPPTYSWQSHDVMDKKRVLPPRTTTSGGLLSLFNISRDTSGYYICTSTNKIRSAFCNVTVSVMPPSMNIGTTASIIGGVVYLLILLMIITVCCWRYKKKKEMEQEQYAMG